MIKKEIKIELAKGLEARPVAVFVQVASQFDSSIFVEYRDKRVNAKSIMGMMSLGIAQGEKVVIAAEGSDEAEAVKGIEKYLTAKE
ncbi:MAG: HPr family phosphocarrier protein [Lachnospiraceae bacterium]|nr:HPr family phosphocarrier protein [Lachnospiraceae bacterium]MBR6357267.1 HPr family phosphocarrier protein [Lachnospiraceae bacterium]